MSIYDRDYMQDGDEALHGAGRRHTAVLILIGLNVLVWLVWQFSYTNPGLAVFMSRNFILDSETAFSPGSLHTLLTACLSQQALFHILFNMMFLWFLGEDIERIYGYRNFYWLYTFTGVAASLAYVAVQRLRGLPGAALGASGAVMGVAVVAAIFDPRKPVSIWGLVTVPLRPLVIIFIVIDLLGAAGSGDHIAHAAHLGGCAAGYVFWKLDLRLFASPGRSNVGLLFRLRRFFARKPSLRVVERVPEELPRDAVVQPATTRAAAGGVAHAAPSRVDPATSRRVDELLSKIARQGMDSLTDEERTFLDESSRKYKGG